MKRIITGTFEAAIGLTFALMVLGGLAGGFIVFPPFGACIGGLVAFFFGSLLFGALYILIEIRDLLRGQGGRLPAQPSVYAPAVSQPSTAIQPVKASPPTPLYAPSAGGCPKCGFSNSPGASKCNFCGAALT